MANDWQYPKGAYKAYVPKGRAWGQLGQGIAGGLQNFASQWMAIKQYEAEKEEKRQQQMREAFEKAQARLEAQRKEVRERTAASMQQMAEWKQDIELEKLRQAGRLAEKAAGREAKEPEDIVGKQAQKHIDKLYKMDTDLGRRQAVELEDAYNSGDLERMQKVLNTALANSDELSRYTEGDKVKSANDYVVLTTAARNLIRLSQQKMGQQATTATQEFMPSGAGAGQPSPENNIQFRADRARAIELMKAGKMNDAAYLMKTWRQFMTEDMAKQMEREAGIK